MTSRENIYVTKTFLPPLEEYEAYLKQIWNSGQLTNQGPLLRQFEAELNKYLAIDRFQFVANGTMALQVALRALDITEGEIITTPFTYVASTSAILWERCRPVYVDIIPDTLCIDPAKIEAAITDETKAILAVHVFGNPCDVEAIEAIAKKHKLKVIYDAAHAFGVTYKGQSLLNYGDASTLSFHATKLMHTIEGGGIVMNDSSINAKADLIKRFGHNYDDHFMLGINAKASEFQAAMGLCNLKYVDGNIAKRQAVADLYDSLLGKEFDHPQFNADASRNYNYYPVLLKDEASLLQCMARLEEHKIFPRRYFYPSLNELPYLDGVHQCPLSEDISRRIMCLPLYPDLDEESVRLICGVLNA